MGTLNTFWDICKPVLFRCTLFVMKKKLAIVFTAILSLFYFQAFPQTANPVLQAVASKLKAYVVKHPTEKAYLHFDKPYYAAGDTIYFKAYVTLGEKHELSNLSGVLHVDLINTVNKIDLSIKLQIANGVAWGDFALPDSLPGGNYHIRAYTRWMRNEDAGAFFDKVIPIGSLLNNKVPESGTYPKTALKGKPDIQFFPEGGSMVCGITSKVAFNAIGADGLGMPVKGVIIDNSGKEITTFMAAHLGMGSFELRPEEGKTYSAKITYANGDQNSTTLPATINSGIVLKIDNSRGDKAALQIISNDTYFAANHGKDINLLVYTSGFANSVNIQLDSAILNLAILKRHLQTGITTVTLLSSSGEPLSERLLFVQNPDQLNLALNTDKTFYHKRGKVHIDIRALNRADSAAMGHFSVAVTDESKVPVDENTETTLLTSLLLTSDLKGYVEQPNYYFNNVTEETQTNLDLVMLTHGYRRFEWKKLLNNDYRPIAYQAERGLEISGMIKNPMGRAISNGTITLLPVKSGPMLSSVSDDKGIFHFSNLVFADTTHFVLSAVNAKGKNLTKITYFDRPDISSVKSDERLMPIVPDTAMALLISNDITQQEELKKNGHTHGILLKEVKIEERKIPAQRSQSYVAEFAADQVIQGKDIQYGGPLSVRLMGMLRRIHFIGGIPVANVNLDGPMETLIDGAPGNLDDVGTDRVKKIEVLMPPTSFIYGTEGRNGILLITTKLGLQAEDIASIGILPIAPTGFYKAREFYSPKYDHPNDNVNHSDLRSTIYWKPEIQTDKDGNGSFEYYNADGTGNYRVVIEGIDDKGNLGRQVYRYKVE